MRERLQPAASGCSQKIDLLLGGLVGGIDLAGALELVERAGEVAALAQDAAPVDVADAGLKPHALEVGLVAEVLGIFERGLPVVFVGGVVVLAHFGVLAALVPCFGRLGVRRERS